MNRKVNKKKIKDRKWYFRQLQWYYIIQFLYLNISSLLNICYQIMGNKFTNTKIPKMNKSNSGVLQNTLNCPSCDMEFATGSPMKKFKQHVTVCLNLLQGSNPLQMHEMLANQQQNQHKIYQQNNQIKGDYMYEKIPLDQQKTQFKWLKIPIFQDNVANNMGPKDVAKLPFQAKLKWFRNNLQKSRIPWTNGADYMKIDRNNMIVSSYLESKKVNMFKQVKIDFLGQKVNDAGGLLREWMHMVIKQLFDYSIGLFQLAGTNQIMYKLKWDQQIDQQFSQQLLHLFGILLGKAIFQKIPLTCYLDYTILRQLCGGRPNLADISGYDIGLYKSWKFVQQNEVDGLDLTFSISKQKGDSTVQQIQLIEGGCQKLVDQTNKKMYVNSCIEFHTVLAVNRSIQFMKQTLHKIIPQNLLCVFEPYQLQMIINGIPFIDVQEWKQSTDYKGEYKKGHKVIQWFWKRVLTFSQEQLAQLLHFCTGSSRPPIQGFKKLESNRGNYAKFLIQSTAFSKLNPYPKGHTCFNRLQLPLYPSQQLLNTYLTAIVKNNLDGVFGLD